MFFLKKYDVIMIIIFCILIGLSGYLSFDFKMVSNILKGAAIILMSAQIYTIITRVLGEKRYKEEKDQYYKNNCNTRNSSFLSDLKGLKKREK